VFEAVAAASEWVMMVESTNADASNGAIVKAKLKTTLAITLLEVDDISSV
jgi:hypothetical protein